jgi:hypothetical protein
MGVKKKKKKNKKEKKSKGKEPNKRTKKEAPIKLKFSHCTFYLFNVSVGSFSLY